MRRLCSGLLGLLLLGCVGEDDPIPPVPRVIGLDVPRIELDSECRPLDGASVLSVSPEGDLWLATPMGSTTELTVRGLDGAERSYSETRELRGATAWSGTELGFVSDAVYVRDGEFVDSLPWPMEGTGLRGICGDPRLDRDGFVIADDLFQRSGGEWWRWRPAMGDFGTIEAIPRNLGACRGEGGETWLVTSSGLWRIGDLGLERVEGLPRVRDVAFGPGFGAFALTDEGLFVGPDRWDTTAFEAGEPRAIAASGSTVYVAAGERLYRLGEEIEELSFERAGAIESLHPFASGLWVEAAGEACLVVEREPLVVRGLRPWMRRGAEALMLEVHGPAGRLSVLRDGAMVHEDATFDGAASVLGVDAGGDGWHSLTLEVAGDTTASREIRYEVVRSSGATYADDIAPLYDMHCAGSACHGPDRDDPERPDLSTYQGWVESAGSIRDRVGQTGDMPPFSERLESWDSEEATLIVGWIDEGMVEGR